MFEIQQAPRGAVAANHLLDGRWAINRPHFTAILNPAAASGDRREHEPDRRHAGATGTTAAPRRVFLSHPSDLGKPNEPGSFVAAAVAAVLRARHAVSDMAYFAARDTSSAASCVEMVVEHRMTSPALR